MREEEDPDLLRTDISLFLKPTYIEVAREAYNPCSAELELHSYTYNIGGQIAKSGRQSD